MSIFTSKMRHNKDMLGTHIPGVMIRAFIWVLVNSLGFPGGSVVKNSPAMQGMEVRSQGWEDTCLENPMDRGAW